MNACSSILKGHQAWYSKIFFPVKLVLFTATAALAGASFQIISRFESLPFVVKYWWVVTCIGTVMLYFSWQAVFDQMVLDFGAGKAREQHRQALRRRLALSLPIAMTFLLWLQPNMEKFLSHVRLAQ